jgi:hypothetical protein
MRAFFLIAGLTLAACACQTSPEDQGTADTDISIQTTDIESLPVGTEAQCVERLTAVVRSRLSAQARRRRRRRGVCDFRHREWDR